MINITDPSSQQSTGSLYLLLIIASLILILSQPELRPGDDERIGRGQSK